MTDARYRKLLRTLFGGVIASGLSSAELKYLSLELRRGRLPDELAMMIDSALHHVGDHRSERPGDDRLIEAERLYKAGRVSKAALINMLTSLGYSPTSTKQSAHEILSEFVNDAPYERVDRLMDLLQTNQGQDRFLTGIGDSRK